MEDRWTIYIRERAKTRNIQNPWLKSKGGGEEANSASEPETEKAS